MNKLVVDTSVFVSLFGAKDTFSENSQAFFSTLPEDIEIVLPTLVVAETLFSLAKQNLSTTAVYEQLMQFTLISLDGPFLEQYKQILAIASLRSSDAIIAATAKLQNARLVSWDSQHLSKANTLCETLSPTQFLKNLKAN